MVVITGEYPPASYLYGVFGLATVSLYHTLR